MADAAIVIGTRLPSGVQSTLGAQSESSLIQEKYLAYEAVEQLVNSRMVDEDIKPTRAQGKVPSTYVFETISLSMCV
jgi:hypothetical protein